MGHGWIYPFIVFGGVLNARGGPRNNHLWHSVGNPWAACGDLADNAEATGALLAARDVVRADTGHKHGNELRIDDGAPLVTTPGPDGVWTANVIAAAEGAHTRAAGTGPDGAADHDTIVTYVSRAMIATSSRVGESPGRHRHSIDAWPDHGFLGTQLGPNRNGREW